MPPKTPKTSRIPKKHRTSSEPTSPKRTQPAQRPSIGVELQSPPDTVSESEQPKQSDYIVDRLFRRGSISLIGGPTYAGKTTLMFQVIRDWMAGLPVFGQESYPAPCCYVTAVHPAHDAWDVMTRVGAEVKVLSTSNSSNARSFEIQCQDALSEVPDLEVIFLDGIHPMCEGNSNDPGTVTTALTTISKILLRYNLTLIASGCFSKPKDHYSSGRDRFAGAYSWLQGSSTFVSIDFVNPENPSDARRSIVIHSKSGLANKLSYRFSQQGLLIPTLNNAPDKDLRFDDFDKTILSYDAGTVMPRKDIVEIGEALGLSESSIKRRLIELQDAGSVGYAKWGHYRIEHKQ